MFDIDLECRFEGIPNKVEDPRAEVVGTWQETSSLSECIKFCDDNPGCDYFRYYPDEIKNCRPREGLFVGERTYNSEATAFYRSCDMGNEDNDIFMIPSNFV